jgi:hypothetical protein
MAAMLPTNNMGVSRGWHNECILSWRLCVYWVVFVLTVLLFIASKSLARLVLWPLFWPIVPAQGDRWGWLWSNWWNEDWQEKPARAALGPPQILLDPTRNRTRAAAVGSQRLTAWALARHHLLYLLITITEIVCMLMVMLVLMLLV